MSAKIVEGRLKLHVSDGGAVPDVFINPIGHVIAHLTQGFVAGSFPQGQSDALIANAEVPLSGGPNGTIFGFVQIGRANFYGAFYAGRIPREGSISLLAHTPPALANPVMLDSIGNPPLPWFSPPDKDTSFLAPAVQSSWGDHPASKIPSKLKNSAVSNVENFLFHFIDDREFWTIFTAKDASGAPRYLAYFHWQVRYEFKFMWRNGAAQLRLSNSFFKVHERNGKGRPTEASIQEVLSNPVGPRANAAFGGAISHAFSPAARGNNRSENPKWFNNVPPDFWA